MCSQTAARQCKDACWNQLDPRCSKNSAPLINTAWLSSLNSCNWALISCSYSDKVTLSPLSIYIQATKSSYNMVEYNMISYIAQQLLNLLTLNVRGLSYLGLTGLTRSISWLLMPWLLTSPGHQQPWYWLCRIGRFLSYLRKDFNYVHRINVKKWQKM